MSEVLRVLVVDDDHRLAKTLVDILRVKGFEAEAAHSGLEALDKVKAASEQGRGRFGCVLTDIKMPEMNGVELLDAIRTIQPEIPLVLMTAYATDTLVGRGLKEGALAALPKPLDINQLLLFFEALRKECSVVAVDDDPAFLKTIGDILEVRGFAVTRVAAPHELEEHLEHDGQIVLLDMKLGETSGLDVLRQIREKHPLLPVILVTGYRQEMAQAIETALDLSAHTCLYKPLQIEELVQVITSLHHRDLGRILGRRDKKER